MTKTIYFDMDGTFVNLYGVENWLDMLINEDTKPYAIAKPLFRMCDFARIIHKLQINGYRIGIISWLSKNGSDEYNERVTMTKEEWLMKHLPSVQFDEIHILKYGTPKSSVATINDILFDDEFNNRNEWGGVAYDVHNILNTLKSFI